MIEFCLLHLYVWLKLFRVVALKQIIVVNIIYFGGEGVKLIRGRRSSEDGEMYQQNELTQNTGGDG